MFNQTSGYSLADIAAATGNSNNNGNNGFGWGGDGWWIILLFLFAGWGRNGFGGGFGGQNDGYTGYPCATQPDVRAAVDQQTLISKLDQQTYGLADSTYALNNAISNGFHGVDNAICTLGYQTQAGTNALASQLAACCCDIERTIGDSTTQGVMNTNAIQSQITACCCDLEKANMQNRFDAQTYNCDTLKAIDKLGDRIIDFMTQDKIATLTSENQSLKFAASQQAQNAYLVRELSDPCPIPAYFVPNPNCCYDYNRFGFGNFGFGGCSANSFFN